MSSQAEPARSLLIVEDDDRLRERLARALRGRGYETREAADYEAAIRHAREDSPEYLLVDLRIPGGSGLDVVREIKAIDASTVVVVLTGYGSIATAVEAVRLGAAEYLTKPADADQIVAAFNRSGGANVPAGEPEQVPSLARVEWEHINRVLADCGGNVSKAARLLNIHRRSLQRKLSRFPSNR
jgi:two-component system, response regulator RegA